MKKVLFFLGLISAVVVSGLELVRNGDSAFQIVIPDNAGHEQLNGFNRRAAELLRDTVARRTGAKLPILTESAMTAGKPAVFIGQVNALGAKPELKLWENRIETRDGNLFLFGDDRRFPAHPASRHYTHSVLGSYKATLTFLEKFCGAVFSGQKDHGVPDGGKADLTVPDNFKYADVPAISYAMIRPLSIEYDLANNFLPAPWYGSYGGHSHNVAIPVDQYHKTNPEYFALVNGKRIYHKERPHYCFSNPKVREMIYQEVLNHLDRGYEMVQLAQSDGFRACQCPPCQKLFGTADKGEQLWIMHRDMAEKLKKDRPGKKVCVIAYGPTVTPPKSFKELPDNMMIELAPYNHKIVESWKNHHVPAGFVNYLYNWGYYPVAGFTPKQSLKFLTEQARSFPPNHIRGVYACGFGELYGLEGPAYHIWGKLLGNPGLDPEKLLKEYCRGVFGPAAPEMEKFYLELDRCVSAFNPGEVDWNDPALLAGTRGKMRRPFQLLTGRYSDENLLKLNDLLTAAEQKSDVPLIRMARKEFDYLRLTASAVNTFLRFEEKGDAADFGKLCALLKERRKFIAALPTRGKIIQSLGGFPLFRNIEPQTLQEGGRLSAPLSVPFDWTENFIDWLSTNRLLPSHRSMKTDGGEQTLVPSTPEVDFSKMIATPKNVRCTFDGENLIVDFINRNAGPKPTSNHQIQIVLGPDAKNRIFFAGRFRNGHMGIYPLKKLNAENKGMGDQFVYNPQAKNLPRILGNFKIEGIGENQSAARVVVPLEKIFGKIPVAGEKWLFNALYIEDWTNHAAWESNLNQQSRRNILDRSGSLEWTRPTK